MRAYDNTTTVAANEFWPRNVQYGITGQIGSDVRDQLQGIADSLHDHIRSWVYDSEDEAYDTLNARLDYILEHNYPHCKGIISEHVSFVIVF